MPRWNTITPKHTVVLAPHCQTVGGDEGILGVLRDSYVAAGGRDSGHAKETLNADLQPFATLVLSA